MRFAFRDVEINQVKAILQTRVNFLIRLNTYPKQIWDVIIHMQGTSECNNFQHAEYIFGLLNNPNNLIIGSKYCVFWVYVSVLYSVCTENSLINLCLYPQSVLQIKVQTPPQIHRGAFILYFRYNQMFFCCILSILFFQHQVKLLCFMISFTILVTSVAIAY